MLAIEHSLCCIGFEEFRWKRVQVFSEKNYIIFDNTELKWCQQKYQSGTINPYWQGSGVRLSRFCGFFPYFGFAHIVTSL